MPRRGMLTARKTTGVLIAMMGVSLALLSGLESAPPGAWRGHALMVCAAVCMTFYSIWSRPFISRLGPLQFTTMGMGVGALFLIAASWTQGSLAPVAHFEVPQWLAMLYLGLFGSAHILSLVLCPKPDNANTCHDLHLGGSRRGDLGRRYPSGRTRWLESDLRHLSGRIRDLDCDDKQTSAWIIRDKGRQIQRKPAIVVDVAM
jgi:hypothetical protein